MIPEKFLKDIFDDLMVLALALSAKNPLKPTDEELNACADYATDVLADILEGWVEKNGGRKIAVISDKDLEDAKKPTDEELEAALRMIFAPTDLEDEDDGEEY